MKSIYQLTALIGNKSDGINDEKFMTAAWILYAWMRREVIDCIPLPELPATVSKSAKTGRSVASIYQPEEHFFTLRSSVFENGIRDTVEAEIMPYRQSLLLKPPRKRPLYAIISTLLNTNIPLSSRKTLSGAFFIHHYFSRFSTSSSSTPANFLASSSEHPCSRSFL